MNAERFDLTNARVSIGGRCIGERTVFGNGTTTPKRTYGALLAFDEERGMLQLDLTQAKDLIDAIAQLPPLLRCAMLGTLLERVAGVELEWSVKQRETKDA